MTNEEIWAIATAGDGSLDPALAEEAGMPLEEFQAEKQRRIEQAAADRQQLEELNRKRSTRSGTGTLELQGLLASLSAHPETAEPGEIEELKAELEARKKEEQPEDPTLEALQYIAKLQEPYTPADDPINGQQIFPEFEAIDADRKTDAPLDAETIKKNIGRLSFRIEYLKSPEDALIAWGAPTEVFKSYLQKHFLELVRIAAEELLADPKQIENKETRTPEQARKLNEVSARESIARFNLFFKTRWYHALSVLDGEQAKFILPANTTGEDGETLDFMPLEAQAALYFFAIHEDLSPIVVAELTEEQQEELRYIFHNLDEFYCAYQQFTIEKKGRPLTADELLGMIYAYIDFRHDNLPKFQAKTQKSKFTRAEEQGAITTIGDRLFVPTDPEYQNAFVTSTGANIGFYRKDSETGARQLAIDVNPAFMQALAKSVLVDIYNGKQGDTSVYFPAFARELGYDLNRYTDPAKADGTQEAQELTTSRADARALFINKKLAEWDSVWGVLPRSNRKEFKLMALHTYDPDTEVFTFQSPYLQEMFSGLMEKEESKLNSGSHYHLWQSDLLYASAANERNPAAVEMATRILQGVQQRGLKPDAKLKQNKGRAFADETEVTFSITCAGLVQDCPQIRERLKSKPNASRRTQELKRAFSAMYKILRTKTDLFRYYKDLTITEVIPTAKTIKAVITITHHGGNPDYQKPFLPIKEEAPEEEEQQ